MGTDHIHALLIGLSLSLSAVSFFIWAWLGGVFDKPDEPALRAFDVESEHLRLANEQILARNEVGQDG